MSVVSDSVREVIVVRAEQRCEYCHLPTRGQVATFPIDHLLPRSGGGATSLDNLALACPHCNGHKWKHSQGADPLSEETCSLFNPRADSWAEHFRWSTEHLGVLEGLTARGRATIQRLEMNAPDMLALRRVLAPLGLFPEVNV